MNDSVHDVCCAVLCCVCTQVMEFYLKVVEPFFGLAMREAELASVKVCACVCVCWWWWCVRVCVCVWMLVGARVACRAGVLAPF